jgi:hypothetical protein
MTSLVAFYLIICVCGQLHISKLMVARLTTDEFLWTLNEVELCRIGVLEDWVGVWDLLE